MADLGGDFGGFVQIGFASTKPTAAYNSEHFLIKFILLTI